MAGTFGGLPEGGRMTDFISLGGSRGGFRAGSSIASRARGGNASRRQRDLPAHVVVYDVIALALDMQPSCREALRCLLEGFDWLSEAGAAPRLAGDAEISQARSRLGAEPLERLHDELVRQEFYGLLMAHCAIRGLLHEAALRADEDPDRLSYLHAAHAARVVRRKRAQAAAMPPSGRKRVA